MGTGILASDNFKIINRLIVNNDLAARKKTGNMVITCSFQNGRKKIKLKTLAPNEFEKFLRGQKTKWRYVCN